MIYKKGQTAVKMRTLSQCSSLSQEQRHRMYRSKITALEKRKLSSQDQVCQVGSSWVLEQQKRLLKEERRYYQTSKGGVRLMPLPPTLSKTNISLPTSQMDMFQSHMDLPPLSQTDMELLSQMDMPPLSQMDPLPPKEVQQIMDTCTSQDPQMPINPPTPLSSLSHLPLELTPMVPLPVEQLPPYDCLSNIIDDEPALLDDVFLSPLPAQNPIRTPLPSCTPASPPPRDSPLPPRTPSPLSSAAHSEANLQGWEDESVEEILAKVGPAKSLKVYEKAWLNLSRFLKKDLGSYEPSEGDYIRYFNFLRKAKKMKFSSLWTIHSSLSNCHAVSYSCLFN